MNPNTLYKLLPAVYRIRDLERGRPLEALLKVIGEQATLIHQDVEHLYDNWFIETCDEWVVPYIGELVGFRRGHPFGEPGDVAAASTELLHKLYPKREVSKLIDVRRRKGTLKVFEDLAFNVAGWKAKAVENCLFQVLSSIAQYSNATKTTTRSSVATAGVDPHFLLRSAQVISNQNSCGCDFTVGGISLRTWRWQALSMSQILPTCIAKKGDWSLYSMSPLGLETLLVVKDDSMKEEAKTISCVDSEEEPTECCPPTIATSSKPSSAVECNPDELMISRFLTRKLLKEDLHRANSKYYGLNKSLFLLGVDKSTIHVHPLNSICTLPNGATVIIDPYLGRIALKGISPMPVTYHYAFSADMGGGEYSRAVSQHEEYKVNRFALNRTGFSDSSMLDRFFGRQSEIRSVGNVTDITSSVGFELSTTGVYPCGFRAIRIHRGQTLEVRASNKSFPILKFGDQDGSLAKLEIEMELGSRLIVDGIAILAKEICIRYIEPSQHSLNLVETNCECNCECNGKSQPREGMPEVFLRHSTIVPEYVSHDADCIVKPREAVGKLVLSLPGGRLVVRNSVLAEIETENCCSSKLYCPVDPLELQINDSIVDRSVHGVCASNAEPAFMKLAVARSTILGNGGDQSSFVHVIESADDSIFLPGLAVARRQIGSVRFSYIGKTVSPLPRRYKCVSSAPPKMVSKKFGNFAYARLTIDCDQRIAAGAESESEMGAFHNLFEPQRKARLEGQLNEFTPVGMRTVLKFVDETRHP